MKIAIIGSRNIKLINLEKLANLQITEIISGGAKGVGLLAKQYAIENNIKYTEFLPDYKKYGRHAPLERNKLIVQSADLIIVYWDGESHGTKFTIDYANKTGTPVKIFYLRT